MSRTRTPAKPTPAKRDFTASALLAGVLVAVAVTGVATVSATGSGALQRALELAGIGHPTIIEQEQERQAAKLAGLDAMVMTMSSELGDVSRQQQVSGSHSDDLISRVAELDREVVTLRDQIAREGLFQQDTVLRGALTDLTGLQTTVEQNKADTDKSVAELSRRLTQVEDQLAQREMTSSITPTIAAAPMNPPRRRVKTARSKPRLASPPLLSGAPDFVER